jgi:hypothetical protein
VKPKSLQHTDLKSNCREKTYIEMIPRPTEAKGNKGSHKTGISSSKCGQKITLLRNLHPAGFLQ